MKAYELWLDESGQFQPEEQVNPELNPSLIGGVLIEEGRITDEEIQNLVMEEGSEGFAHATDYTTKQAVEVQVPALMFLREKGAHFVYFENRERIGNLDNRELYLRLMARGLVRLMRRIGQEGEFRLDIYIARRVDPGRNKEFILADEYTVKLKKYIHEERRRGILDFEENCIVNFSILSARRESRLMLADFASNARLTRDSEKYVNVRKELSEIFEEDYIFSFSRIETSASRINALLSSGDLSEALMELYTGYGSIVHKKVFAQIMKRFEKLSYRLKRLQLKSFVSSVVAYVRSETEFERSEAAVKNIISEFFPEIQKRQIHVQTDEPLFQLYAGLLDMYLREGDILHAGPVLEEMGDIVHGMGYRMENLMHLYQYNDRKALYEIICMEYENAVKTMDQTIETMTGLMEQIKKDPVITGAFGGVKMASEHLGDAYCMKVYAEMFLQREQKDLYEKSLKKDTELALGQYQYEGELERNQQYRAHVEMEQGNYEEALKWLLSTRQIEYDTEQVEMCCKQYLMDAREEDRLSRNYYLMYYVELMYEAQRGGLNTLSDHMYSALKKDKVVYHEFFGESKTEIQSDYKADVEVNEDVLRNILGMQKGVYHPVEIVRWKYGLFLADRGDHKKAIKWLDLALEVCGDNVEYLELQVIALAIRMDKLACFLSINEPYRGMIKMVSETREAIRIEAAVIEKMKSVPPRILEFVRAVKKSENRVSCIWKEAVNYRDEVAAVARRIAY